MVTKNSIENYAEYEQLVGGVETLFNKTELTLEEYAEAAGKTVQESVSEWAELTAGARIVQNNSEKAFQTAGMSMNQYMETVTSFSAALINGLEGDTVAAAKAADQAIIDMSDNANKMGTSIDMIQNAYQGFAKQNYTMLDNLKLGYGGTAGEMARLVNESGVLADGITVDAKSINSVSFDKIAEAIHVIQDRMGITGTTAREASETISGSVASAKAAWQNLITFMASTDPEDIGYLDVYVQQFTESIKTAANNIVPVLSQALSGIGAVIQDLAPIIAEELPAMIEGVLPSLLNAGASLLTGIMSGIITAAPTLVEAATTALSTLVTFLIDNLPMLATAAVEIVSTLGSSIAENLPAIIDAGMEMLDKLVYGIESGLPDMMARLPQIITDFLNFCTSNLPKIVSKGFDLLISFTTGIINAIPSFVAKLPQIITAYVNYVTTMFPTIIQKGTELLVKMVTGIIKGIPQLVAALPQIIAAIVNGIGNLMGGIVNIGKNIVQGIWNGISGMVSWFTSKVKNFFSGIVNGVKNMLGIHSPSKVFAGIGGFMAEGLGEGWDDAYSRIERDINKDLDFSGNISTSGTLTTAGGGNAFADRFSVLPPVNLTVNVNGLHYYNEQDLARGIVEDIAFELQKMVERMEAVWGAP